MTSEQGNAPSAMPVEDYDRSWPQWSDFIKYNPGARHRRRLVLSVMRRLPFTSFLDVGCGNAEMLATVAEHFPTVRTLAGVDLSPEVIKTNQKALPGIQFAVANLDRESLIDKVGRTFDLVLCSEVVEHLEDRRRAFQNLAAAVAPGGHLIITCPTGPVYATEVRMGHTTHPDADELRGHAAASGLEPARVLNWGFPIYSFTKWATNVNADWAYKNFAEGAYNLPKKAVSLALYGLNFLNSPSSERGCQLVAVFRKPR